MTRKQARILVGLLLVLAAACTTSRSEDDASVPPTLHAGVSGVVGTLTATGGRSGNRGDVVGQILVWPATRGPSTSTTEMFGRPLEAVATSGTFSIELPPGGYELRATELGGRSCGTRTVEIAAGHTTEVAFVCEHR